MKASIPMPAVIGIVVVLLVAAVGYFFWSADQTPRTPRPDPALFKGGGPNGSTGGTLPQGQ